MSRDAGRDLSACPETEQLLSGRAHDDAPSVHVCPRHAERRPTDEAYLRNGGGSVSQTTSRPTPPDKSTGLSRNAWPGGPSGNPDAVITPPSIIVNGAVENDDPPPYAAIPPPYSAIAPPNHVGWSYDLFSFGDSYPTSAPSYRVEIPLAPLQDSLTPAATAGFHPGGTDGQHAPFPTTLTPYRFFKYGWRASSLAPRETSFPDNGIAEKIDDKKSRRYGAILVAAAVIVFLMVLSLMVRFIMERSLWRK